MNEKKLAEGLRSGDTGALKSIIEAYSGYVRTVAFNFSRGSLSQQDIEEVIADVFYKLYACRGNIDPELGLRSYLSAAARNAVKDRFRKQRPAAEDITELEIPSDFLLEDAAEMNDIMRCLYEGLELLPKTDREVFFRFYFYGETAARIAESLGQTRGAVEKRLARVRQKLRSYLIERGYDHA